MNAKELYGQLEKDFVPKGMEEGWAKNMGELEPYLSENFKKRSVGLVCDFTKTINKVYCAVFPSQEIMQKIIDDGTTDAMLFVHHPSNWDISRAPNIFYQMESSLVEKFKENRISIFSFHLPLDNFGEYSVSKALADALSIEIEKPFATFLEADCGIIGKTNCKNMNELQDQFSNELGHETRLYVYGEDEIKDGRVCIIGGNGNQKDFVSEIIENDVKVLITGVSTNLDIKNSAAPVTYSELHEILKKNKINILGGTHYSTEKHACQNLCTYFEKLGITSTFIEGEPGLEDL